MAGHAKCKSEGSAQITTHEHVPSSGTPMKLVLLLNTGVRSSILTNSSATFANIKSDIAQDWPEDFEGPAPDKKRLKILHQGKFLDDAKTPQDLNIASGTVVHLFVRPSSAKLAHDAEEDKQVLKTGSSCCIIA